MTPAQQRAVEGVCRVLAGVYADEADTEERARNIVQGLMVPDGDAFAGVAEAIGLRPLVRHVDGEKLALRCLVVFVHAMAGEPLSHLATKTQLLAYGVPFSWRIEEATVVFEGAA